MQSNNTAAAPQNVADRRALAVLAGYAPVPVPLRLRLREAANCQQRVERKAASR